MNEILSLNHITKSFPGVKALDDVTLSFFEGEVHSICGENGAGKSTLMKILSGVYKSDSGSIFVSNEKVNIHNPLDAHKHGISIIFQEFNLVEQLSVSENIFLGRLSSKSHINWKNVNEKTNEIFKYIGYEIDPNKLIKELSVAEKQIVEIAKALSYNSKVIIMDEPSSSLTDNEVEKLFSVISDLKKKKITVIYISHKLEEVLRISDRITVMRDGKVISTENIDKVSIEGIVEQMVGRPINQEYPKRLVNTSLEKEVVLEVNNLSSTIGFSDISFSLKKGEVLGIAGLVGSKRTEVVRSIFGADAYDSGEIKINGENVLIKSPKDAIKLGVALLTEDRKKQGLHLELPVSSNISCANLRGLSKNGLINYSHEKKNAMEYINKLGIKTPSIKQRVVNLSGGNQQKVVLAKWLFANANILILDEPTRGIDVGAKMEIYSLINNLVNQGKSIIMISSELPELLGMSDRIIVLHEGKITGELVGEHISADDVMHAMLRKEE